jgi:hypothetical protein
LYLVSNSLRTRNIFINALLYCIRNIIWSNYRCPQIHFPYTAHSIPRFCCGEYRLVLYSIRSIIWSKCTKCQLDLSIIDAKFCGTAVLSVDWIRSTLHKVLYGPNVASVSQASSVILYNIIWFCFIECRLDLFHNTRSVMWSNCGGCHLDLAYNTQKYYMVKL